jgi:hypothetical protein
MDWQRASNGGHRNDRQKGSGTKQVLKSARQDAVTGDPYRLTSCTPRRCGHVDCCQRAMVSITQTGEFDALAQMSHVMSVVGSFCL